MNNSSLEVVTKTPSLQNDEPQKKVEIAESYEKSIYSFNGNVEKFLKFFSEKTAILFNLTSKNDFLVLFSILWKNLDYSNEVDLSHSAKKKLQLTSGLNRQAVAKSLNNLISSNILILKDEAFKIYTLNPHLFGQGSFRDVSHLRQTLVMDYDFEKNEAIRKITTSSVTTLGRHILKNPSNFDVVEYNEEMDNIHTKQEIGVIEKEVIDVNEVNPKVIKQPCEQETKPRESLFDVDSIDGNNKQDTNSNTSEEIEKMIAAGRPVLVGTTSVEISEMLSKMLDMRKIPHNVLNAKLHQKEAEIVALAGQSSTVTIATNMAGRGTDIKLSPEVKAAGGLAIIGTERHESRRVDRQLRGRAGRQGDPGSSVFFVSLEDDLMRLFSSERIASVMDKLGFKEGEMIEHNMISKSIERAQKKVEENNFGIRKRLLEYDDVMNKQRTVVYTKRRHALMGERIGMDIVNMIWDRCANAVNAPDYENSKMDILQTLAMEPPFTEQEFREEKKEALAEKTFNAAMELFKRKTERMAQIAYPVIKQVYENQGFMYQNILIPITDGKRIYNISCNLKTAYETEGKEIVKSFEKAILLHVIDEAWKENLRELDDLRHSVQNASYEQKDPLLIYKLESVNLFDAMVDKINNQTVSILMRGQIPVREPQEVRQAAPEQRQDMSQYREQKQDLSDPNQQAAAAQDTREKPKREPLRVQKTVGRNDPCPCGSGKKYKNCHGKNL